MSSYMPELEALRVDHDHPHVVGRRAVEDAREHRVEADRLAGAGRAGDQQVRHRREVGHERLAVNGLAEREASASTSSACRRRTRAARAARSLRGSGLGIWMPTVALPGMRSISTDSACIARHRSSARPVTLRVLHAGVGLELERRDDRARDGSAPPSLRPRTRGTSPRAAAPSPSARARRSCARPSAASSSDERRQRVARPGGARQRSGSGSGSGGATPASSAAFFCTTGGVGARPAARRVRSRAPAVRAARGLGSAGRSWPVFFSAPSASTGVSFLPYFTSTSRRCLALRRSSRHSRNASTPCAASACRRRRTAR